MRGVLVVLIKAWRRSTEPEECNGSDKCLKKMLGSVSERLCGMLTEHYPYMIKYLKLESLVKSAYIHVEFQHPIHGLRSLINIIDPYVPNRYATEVRIYEEATVDFVDISIDDGYLEVELHGRQKGETEPRLLYRVYEADALVQLLMPAFRQALENAEPISRSEKAIEWLRELISTANELADSDVIKNIRPIDLLDSRRRVNELFVIFVSPTPSVEKLYMQLALKQHGVEVKPHAIVASFWVKEEVTKNANVLLKDTGTGEPHMGIWGDMDKNRARKRLAELLKVIDLSKIEATIDEYLEAYKLVTVATSYTNLFSAYS